jgi:exonuclease VII small subunit
MSLFEKKPKTLEEVVRRVRNGEQKFDPSLREFLDSFYMKPDSREQAIEQRPASIDAVHDAYVAAVAEHLARVFGLAIPPWSEGHGNGLREPFFAGGLQSLKGVLVAESPTAFRRRLLFVSKDALSRPRM